MSRRFILNAKEYDEIVWALTQNQKFRVVEEVSWSRVFQWERKSQGFVRSTVTVTLHFSGRMEIRWVNNPPRGDDGSIKIKPTTRVEHYKDLQTMRLAYTVTKGITVPGFLL